MKYLKGFSKYCPLVDTKKMHYGNFAYRVELHISGAFLLGRARSAKKYYASYSKFEELVNAHVKRAKEELSSNDDSRWMSTWAMARRLETAQALAKPLFHLSTLMQSMKSKSVRFRAEQATLTVYFETEEQTLSFLNSITDLWKGLREIERPASAIAKDKLKERVIFLKTMPKYKWKVEIKRKKYSPEARKQIWEYTQNFPDTIILPKGIRNRLNPESGWDWNQGNYYVNDESAILFLKMVAPDFVHRIYKLEQQPE